MTDSFQSALHDIFGFGEFRPLQEEAVTAAMDGRDVLVVMPTGAGKSLCFQLPAALTEGVTLVVSPLIALMRDQVDALNRRPVFEELGCACLTSLQTSDEQYDILSQLRAGRLRLLYVAPERFRSAGFLDALKSVPIARFVVDEAHCISEWGHDFRPDYLALKDVLETLGRPSVIAATASATKRVQQSIVTNLGLADPVVLVGGFNRPNLHFAVHRCTTERDREERLARALPKLAARGGSGLIYVATRKQCEQIAEIADEALTPLGQRAGYYHAGMDADLRNRMQREWLAGERQVLVATNAFGMGIDKADVRFVIHCACPDSIESYYQEAGRAGRDGHKSRCVILYHFTDKRTREWLIDNENMTVDAIGQAFDQIRGEAQDGIVRLPNLWGMAAFGWSVTKTRLTVSELERAELVERVGQTADSLTLRIKRADFPPEARHRIGADLAKQRTERFRRLDEIVDYCKTPHCRRRTVLDYFGDRQEPPPSAFCCDNCDTPAPQPPILGEQKRLPQMPMPSAIDPTDIYSLLQGLDALRPALGKSRLNKLLRGTGTRETPGMRAEDSPLYGVLRGCTRDQADQFFTDLKAAGLLHQADEDAYFVCTITSKGRAVWQERLPVSVRIPADPSRWLSSGDGDDTLLEELRAWRSKEATQAALPPYCIFNDTTLMEIARHKPQTEEAFLAINGVGRKKLERYGTEILAMTRGAGLATSGAAG